MDNKIPVLSVYDKDGNRIEIPAVAGRSAYAEAVAQGYTGTREEFGREQAEFAANAAKVASDRNAVEQAKSDTEQIKSDALTEVEAEKDATVQAVQDEGAVQIAAVRNAAEAKKNEIAGLDAVQFISQDKTDEEKTQARVNIDAASQKEVDSLSEAIENKLDKSGGTLSGKIVLQTDNQNVGFTNSGDMKIFGYGNIDSVSHLRIGDATRPVQLRGSAERPKYNDGELVLKSEFDTVMQAYIDDIAELVGGDA